MSEQELREFFERLNQHLGPRSQEIAAHCLEVLLANPGSHPTDIPKLLTDPGFRQRLLATVGQQDVLAFWEDYDKESPGRQHMIMMSLLNHVNEILWKEWYEPRF